MAGSNIVITAGTTLANKEFHVPKGSVVQLVGFGFVAAGDTFDVQVSYDRGDNYVPCYDDGGNLVLVGAGGAAGIRNPVNLIGPGFFNVKRVAGKTDDIGCALIETTAE